MKKTIHDRAYGALVATLRDSRRCRGLRQEDVARRLGVTRTWVTKIEQRELRLDVIQLVRLCRIYGLSAHRLVRELEEELADSDSSFLAIRNGVVGGSHHQSSWLGKIVHHQ